MLLEILSIILLYKKRVGLTTLAIFTLTQGTVLQFWTPGSLRGYGCGTPNGSLWTIPILIQFYILIWILRKPLKNKKPVFWIAVEIVLIFVGLLNPIVEKNVPEITYKLYCQTIIPYLWIFGLGITVSKYWSLISEYLKRFFFVFVIAYVIYCISGFDFLSGGYPVIKVIVTSLCVLGLAFQFPKLKVKWDISYELYIVHMIIVNILITVGLMHGTGMIIAIVSSIIVSGAVFWINRTFIVKDIHHNELKSD